MSASRSPRDFIARHLLDVPRSGIRDFFDIVSQMDDVISLGVGEPDFVTPWHIREGSMFALERGATSYTSNLGLPKLRHALSDYVEGVFGAVYDPDAILITVGVSEGLDLALRAITNPGDEILYHEPCYVSYAPSIVFAHGVPVPVRTRREEDFRLTRAMLEEKVSPRTRALLLNFPNNPTGAKLEAEDLQDIAAFAVEHDLLVITDEIYAELTYEGAHRSLVALPGMAERSILLHGFSKAWAMTGFRLGYACAPHDLTEAMMKIHQYSMLCAPILSQEAAYEALTQPEIDIGEMRDEYRRRRNFIHARLNDMGLPCHRPQGAFYAFPYVGDTGLTTYDFAMKLLDEEKVAAVPGSAFGPSGEGYLRCAYASSMEDLKTAMDRIEALIGRL